MNINRETDLLVVETLVRKYREYKQQKEEAEAGLKDIKPTLVNHTIDHGKVKKKEGKNGDIVTSKVKVLDFILTFSRFGKVTFDKDGFFSNLQTMFEDPSQLTFLDDKKMTSDDKRIKLFFEIKQIRDAAMKLSEDTKFDIK
jgi:hypothetical protein